MKPTGIYAAAVTPRREGALAIDAGAALDLIDWLCDRGVGGIVLLGSTGEFPHYSIDQRIAFADAAVKRSRVPVLVNASHSTHDGALLLARAARDSGAAGAAVMPPYFFRYAQPQLFDFYQWLGDRLDGGLYLYNIPFFTTPLEASTARRLLETGRFAGIKDSSGDIDYLAQLLPLRGDNLAVFVGNDAVFHPLRAAGADGVVSGVSCALPELMLALDQAIAGGDADLAETLDGHLQEFIRRIDLFPAPVGVKEAVKARGLPAPGHSIPFGPQTQKDIDRFQAWLKNWLPGVLEDSRR